MCKSRQGKWQTSDKEKKRKGKKEKKEKIEKNYIHGKIFHACGY